MFPPALFLRKMQQLLPSEEYAQFVACYEQSPQVGLRLNPLKVGDVAELGADLFALEPIEQIANGYRVLAGEAGKHPYHIAGLYYMQEPAAMAVGQLLAPQAGEWVLDLAAAPGGKSTHLAGLMADDGLLVANDVSRSRAKELAHNLERWGVRNSLITSNTPEQLVETFGPVFDKVLVDAPCSGEGMFRKLGAFDWSEDLVAMCATRQAHVLQTAVHLVRPNGTIVYSTCTFSPEENEGVIAQFLAQNPEFALVQPSWQDAFAHGQPAWGDGNPALSRTVRLWPHRYKGEGHFIAVLQKQKGTAVKPRYQAPMRLPKQALAVWQAFAQETLHMQWEPERLYLSPQGYLSLLPAIALEVGKLAVLRHGLPLGEVRKKHFKPAHQLALTLKANELVQTVSFEATSEALKRYLAGEDLAIDRHRANGWVLVQVDNWGIGWGKVVNGRLKNHYPKGLRLPFRA